jgi:hypothetical protein
MDYVIEPTFEIDKKGRVICQSHSQFPLFAMDGKDRFQDQQMEKNLSCKTCSHYFNDDCFFPRSEIDKIDQDRTNRKLTCRLCGMKIDRMLTVIQKLYYQEKFNIEMPLICCICYDSLKKKNYIEKSKWRANFFLSNALCIVYSLVSTVFSLLILNFSFIGILILFLSLLLLYLNLRRRKKIIEGIDYYKKHFLEEKDSQNTLQVD